MVVRVTLIVLGFLVVTGVVIALARTSTARWERDKRAAVVARPGVTAPRTTPAGSAARVAGAMVGTMAAAVHTRASRFAPVKAVAGMLPRVRQRVVLRVQPIPRVVRILWSSLVGSGLRKARSTMPGSPAVPVDDSQETDEALPPDPRPSRGARAVGGDDAAGRTMFHRPGRLPRRRALRFLHRQERTEDPRVLHGDRDESPTAR
jgi:hypothetical protein